MSLLARRNELLQHFRQASSMQWIGAKFSLAFCGVDLLQCLRLPRGGGPHRASIMSAERSPLATRRILRTVLASSAAPQVT